VIDVVVTTAVPDASVEVVESVAGVPERSAVASARAFSLDPANVANGAATRWATRSCPAESVVAGACVSDAAPVVDVLPVVVPVVVVDGGVPALVPVVVVGLVLLPGMGTNPMFVAAGARGSEPAANDGAFVPAAIAATIASTSGFKGDESCFTVRTPWRFRRLAAGCG
jgi:hypothetical protein